MKAINFKLASFTFAAMLLASCSDSDNVDPSVLNPSAIGEEVTSITDAQTLAARVINLKNPSYTSSKVRAKLASRATVEAPNLGIAAEMPAEPSVPANAKHLTDIANRYDRQNNVGGVYVIDASDKLEDYYELTNATIYVKGKLNLNIINGQNTVYVLSGGTLDNYGNYKAPKLYNYGTTNFSGGLDVGSGCVFMSNKGLDLGSNELKVQNGGILYLGGATKASSFYATNGTPIANIKGDLTLTGGFTANATTQIKVSGNIKATSFSATSSNVEVGRELQNSGNFTANNANVNIGGNSTSGYTSITTNSNVKIAGNFNLGNNSYNINSSEAEITGVLTTNGFNPGKGQTSKIDGGIKGIENVWTTAIEGTTVLGAKTDFKNLTINDEGKIWICASDIDGTLKLTGNGSECHINYIKAKAIDQCAGSKIWLVNNSVIECEGQYENKNNGNGSTITLEGDKAVAYVKTKVFKFNGGGNTRACYAFNATGSSSKVWLDAETLDNADYTAYPLPYGIPFKDVEWTNVINARAEENKGKIDLSKATQAECGYIINPTTPDTPDTPDTPKGKELDDIGHLTYDHTHDISATCIQPYNGKMYMSYHTRGDGHGACIEVFETKNKQTQLLQYLQDKEQNLDFNHLMVDPNNGNPMVYVVGNSKKDAAMLARIDINSDGKLNTEVKEIDATTAINPLTIVPLDKNVENKTNTDENAIVRDGDKLLVMSTKGYEVYNANDLTYLGGKALPGKAKHIALNGNEMATFYYTSRPKSVNAEVAGKVELFTKGQDILSASPSNTIDVASIAPNNGKNTIAIDGNNIYVCRSEKGLTCYDKSSGAEKWTWVAPAAANTGKPLGYANGVTYDANYIYLASGGYGIVVLDKNKMEDGKPVVVARARAEAVTDETTGKKSYNSANYVTLAKDAVTNDTYIYVAYGKSRLQVYQLVDAVIGNNGASTSTQK